MAFLLRRLWGGPWRAVPLLLIALALARSGVDAQDALSIRGQRDLTFGAVLRGVPTVVDVLTRSAGRWEVRGESNAEVRIDLILPSALTSASGDELPLSFGSADGAFSSHPQGRGAQVVDPQLPVIVSFDWRGKLYLFLGGTALPGAMQPAGAYAATISLTVSYTGN